MADPSAISPFLGGTLSQESFLSNPQRAGEAAVRRQGWVEPSAKRLRAFLSVKSNCNTQNTHLWNFFNRLTHGVQQVVFKQTTCCPEREKERARERKRGIQNKRARAHSRSSRACANERERARETVREGKSERELRERMREGTGACAPRREQCIRSIDVGMHPDPCGICICIHIHVQRVPVQYTYLFLSLSVSLTHFPPFLPPCLHFNALKSIH